LQEKCAYYVFSRILRVQEKWAMPQITNWFGDIVSEPAVIVDAQSAAEIAAILKDPVKFPSPVRAVGSIHSTSACTVAEGGTVIRMKGMNKILAIGKDTVTVQAGAQHIDVSQALEKKKLQFFVNTEIGNLTAGSAACCGTKDAAMPGELGQVNSYVTAVKMVLPSGEMREVSDESDAKLMTQIRSSYGTFGIVTEVTFRVRKLTPMAVHHETFTLEDFTAQFPALLKRGDSLMFYIFPFENLITVEFRRYNPEAKGPANRHAWSIRNFQWATSGPAACADATKLIADKGIRYKIIDGLNQTWRFTLENVVSSENTVPGDQIIRYPSPPATSKYTFSFWAFPEKDYPAALAAYFQFSREYYQATGYRVDMLNVGYRVTKDRSSLLSYSDSANVITIDPVCTGNPGWKEFVTAYNDFCSSHGGFPLINQTESFTREQAVKAYGTRLDTLAKARKKFDPEGRLLTPYFKDLLGIA
jgi:hypothetical protein